MNAHATEAVRRAAADAGGLSITDDEILQVAIENGIKFRTGHGAIKFARALLNRSPDVMAARRSKGCPCDPLGTDGFACPDPITHKLGCETTTPVMAVDLCPCGFDSTACAHHNKEGDCTHSPDAPMTTDEAREYLVNFMEQHFTDKTYHRYIRGDSMRIGPMAGDFAWQMAQALRKLARPAAMGAAGLDRAELEQRMYAWSKAEGWDATAKAMQAVVDLVQPAASAAQQPDFAAIDGKRMSELSPAQREDARELWLRNQYGWFGMADHEAGTHIKFLLDRLDNARPTASGAVDLPVIDKHLDAVLRASGSALRHYSMQKKLDDMRAAMRAAIEGGAA